MTEIVNLTPHPLRIYDIDCPEQLASPEDHAIRVTYPAAETPARIATIDLGTQSMYPPIELVEYSHVHDLPERREGVRYVVPLVVALAAAGRRSDLLSPYMEVRNLEGTVIGCRMLQQVV